MTGLWDLLFRFFSGGSRIPYLDVGVRNIFCVQIMLFIFDCSSYPTIEWFYPL